MPGSAVVAGLVVVALVDPHPAATAVIASRASGPATPRGSANTPGAPGRPSIRKALMGLPSQRWLT